MLACPTSQSALPWFTQASATTFRFYSYYGSATGPTPIDGKTTYVSVGAEVYQGYLITVSGLVAGDTIVLSRTGDTRPLFLNPTKIAGRDSEAGYAYQAASYTSGSSYYFNYTNGNTIFTGENTDFNTNSSSLISIGLKSGTTDVGANANYTLASGSFNWNMTLKEVNQYDWALSGAAAGVYSVEYDGSAHTMTATAQTASYADITSIDGKVPTNVTVTVSSYTGTRTATAKSDYSVNVAQVSVSSTYVLKAAASNKSWSITAKTITIVPKDWNGYASKGRVYDGTTDFKGYEASGMTTTFSGNTATIATGVGSQTVTISAT